MCKDVYLDWIDIKAPKAPKTTNGLTVKDMEALTVRLKLALDEMVVYQELEDILYGVVFSFMGEKGLIQE